MSSKRIWAASLAAVVSICAVGSAEAAKTVLTFEGVITNGFDGQGKIFGQSDLAGLSYEVSYLIDETIYQSRSAIPTAPVGTDQYHYQVIGGYGAQTPILEVTLKVNGVTESFDYADYSAEFAYGGISWMNSPAAPFGTLDIRGDLGRVVDYSGGVGAGRDYVNFVNQATSPTLIPYLLNDGWDPTQFNFSAIPIYFARAWGDARGGYDFYYQINSGTVTSARLEAYVPPGNGGGDPGVVPEPATWAMMILGLGAAGSVIRRRRAIAA